MREERGKGRRKSGDGRGRWKRGKEEGRRRIVVQVWFKCGSSVVQVWFTASFQRKLGRNKTKPESLEKRLASSILSEIGTSVHTHRHHSVTTLTTTRTMQVCLVLCKWNARTQQQLKPTIKSLHKEIQPEN